MKFDPSPDELIRAVFPRRSGRSAARALSCGVRYVRKLMRGESPLTRRHLSILLAIAERGPQDGKDRLAREIKVAEERCQAELAEVLGAQMWLRTKLRHKEQEFIRTGKPGRPRRRLKPEAVRSPAAVWISNSGSDTGCNECVPGIVRRMRRPKQEVARSPGRTAVWISNHD
jgi:hypothetical protein